MLKCIVEGAWAGGGVAVSCQFWYRDSRYRESRSLPDTQICHFTCNFQSVDNCFNHTFRSFISCSETNSLPHHNDDGIVHG